MSTDSWSLVEMVLPFFKKWNYQGIAEVELKIDSRDGKAKLIEINPRVWRYIGFCIRCGVNFPLLACELALGGNNHNSQYPPYQTGIKYIDQHLYLKIILSNLKANSDNSKELIRVFSDLRGKKVNTNFDLSDIKHHFAKMLQSNAKK